MSKKKNLLQKTTARLKEPSTYAGLAGILAGLNSIFNLHGTEQVANVVAGAGQALATGASPAMLIGTVLTGLFAMFLPEKK